MKVDGTQVDAKAQRVLQCIKENGPVNTTETRGLTGIESGDVVRYRFKRLEDAGLVHLSKDESVDESQRPYQAEITEQGRVATQRSGFQARPGERDFTERLNYLENQIERLQDENRRLKDMLVGGDLPDIIALRHGVMGINNYLVKEASADLASHNPSPDKRPDTSADDLGQTIQR